MSSVMDWLDTYLNWSLIYRVLLQLGENAVAKHTRVLGSKPVFCRMVTLPASTSLAGSLLAKLDQTVKSVPPVLSVPHLLVAKEVGGPQPFAANQQALGHKFGGFAVQVQVGICVGGSGRPRPCGRHRACSSRYCCCPGCTHYQQIPYQLRELALLSRNQSFLV